MQPELRVTAYWHARHHGLPCDLDFLCELGLRAARLARYYRIPPWQVPEGPYLVHQWPEWVWDAVVMAGHAAEHGDFTAYRDPACPRCNYDTHRCPGCGEPLDHGTEACDGCGGGAVIPPWCPLPRGDMALRAIGYLGRGLT